MRAQTAEAEPIYLIATHNIKVSDENVRETQRDKDLEELAASIERHGLLQPVLLRGTFSKPRISSLSANAVCWLTVGFWSIETRSGYVFGPSSPATSATPMPPSSR